MRMGVVGLTVIGCVAPMVAHASVVSFGYDSRQHVEIEARTRLTARVQHGVLFNAGKGVSYTAVTTHKLSSRVSVYGGLEVPMLPLQGAVKIGASYKALARLRLYVDVRRNLTHGSKMPVVRVGFRIRF